MPTTVETTSVRISTRAKSTLQELASRENKSMQAVLEEAIQHFQREKLIDEANAAFARLKADPEAWTEELAERALWESTLADGLDKEE